jgi:hypothetical protein
VTDFDVTGYAQSLSQADLALARFGALMANLMPFWPKLVPLFISWMREQFETEGAFAGDPWEQLSEPYATQKARLNPGKGILVASGDLRGAASRPERFPTPRTLTLRVNEAGYEHHGPILEYLQKGTTNMPARPLLFETLPLPAQAELQVAAEEYVREALLISGLGR